MVKLKDALKGELSNIPLEERTKHYQGRVKALEDQVEHLMRITHLTTHQNVAKLEPVVRRTEAGMNYIRSSAVTTDINLRKLTKDMDGISVTLDTYLKAFEEKVTKANLDAHTYLAITLTEVLKQAECKWQQNALPTARDIDGVRFRDRMLPGPMLFVFHQPCGHAA